MYVRSSIYIYQVHLSESWSFKGISQVHLSESLSYTSQKHLSESWSFKVQLKYTSWSTLTEVYLTYTLH
jgi:long-subunit fatty acid transport protein